MESHPYTKTRGVGPVTTQLTPRAEPASCPLRARFLEDPQAHPAHGPVHQHAERGANPLCHLLQIQSARVRAVLAARAMIDRDVKIEHARIAHSERLCGRRRPRTHNHPGHKCRSAKGRRIISLREEQKELPWNHILTQNLGGVGPVTTQLTPGADLTSPSRGHLSRPQLQLGYNIYSKYRARNGAMRVS